MSEACPEKNDNSDCHFIVGPYRQVYELGSSKKGIMFPHGDCYCRNLLPDSYVCEKHFNQIPKNDLKQNPNEIDGSIYGISCKAGIKVTSVSSTVGIASFREHQIEAYVSRETLESLLPGVLIILDDFKRRNLAYVAACCLE